MVTALTGAQKEQKFYNIMMAFQAFGGKSLRALDAARVSTDEELAKMEACLSRMADALRKEDANEWPDLHKLATEINNRLAQPL